jgi:hypothetical protein
VLSYEAGGVDWVPDVRVAYKADLAEQGRRWIEHHRARYDALEEVRRTLGAATVLVGHTADDQAETVLLNLMRGSAAAGLGAMAERRGSVVRPLLRLRRSDCEAVCALIGVAPVRDPMNADPAFRRVDIAVAERDAPGNALARLTGYVAGGDER